MIRNASLVLALTLLGLLPRVSEAKTQLSVLSFNDKIMESECVSHEAWDGELSSDLQKSLVVALTRRGRFNVASAPGNETGSEAAKSAHYAVRGTITKLEVCDVGADAPLRATIETAANSNTIASGDRRIASAILSNDNFDPQTDDDEISTQFQEEASESGSTGEVKVAAGSKFANVEVTIEVVDLETGKVATRAVGKGEAKSLDRAKLNSRGEAEVAVTAAERAMEEVAKEIARSLPDRASEAMPLPTVEKARIRHDDLSAIRRHTGPSKAEIALTQAAIPLSREPSAMSARKGQAATPAQRCGSHRTPANEARPKTLCASGDKSKKGEFFACTILRTTSKGKSNEAKFAIVEDEPCSPKSKGKHSKLSEKIVSKSKIYLAHPGTPAVAGTKVAVSCKESGLPCEASKTAKLKAAPQAHSSDRYQACVVSKRSKEQGKTQLKLDCSGRQVMVTASSVYRLTPFNPRNVSSR